MDKVDRFAWKPYTTAILLGGFAIALVALIAWFMMQNFKPTTTVKLGGGVYQVQVANTKESRTKGLSGVEKLPVNGGLLMDFGEEQQWGIWMKDMKIPLDIIWLDKNNKVTHIEKNVSHELGESKTFTPKTPSRYVLELPAGAASQAGIQLNQIAAFKLNGDEI